MKKLLLLFGFICLASFSQASATGSSKSDELLKKSAIPESTPIPFNAEAITQESPAISTGYYFVDSDESNLPIYWRVSYESVQLDYETHLWKRILSGPRQVDSTYWTVNPNEGLGFFRNPGKPANKSYFLPGLVNGTDSTNNAIAGPIPLNLNEGFYFNGMRYDSFYVSTNGVIALTNRRYFYDATGSRTIPPGATSCYDPMSMDWFATGRTTRLEGAASLTDPIPDDFGYQYSVLGNNKSDTLKGIRANSPGDGLDKFEPANKAAIIAPFWGPLQFLQWDKLRNTPKDGTRVFYKKSIAKDKITIYIENVQPQAGTHSLMGDTYTAPRDGDYDTDNNFCDASASVVLNRLDSSITFNYVRFRGGANLNTNPKIRVGANLVFQGISYGGVRGFARHVNYDGVNSPASPWAANGEYMQTTHHNKKVDPSQNHYLKDFLGIKYKQYQNTLRVIGTKFKVRKKSRTANNDFTEVVNEVDNYELIAGDEKLGAIQPVMTIQNLSNHIQGIKGVNFVPQGLTFRARINIENEVTGTVVYTETVAITDSALRAPETSYQKVRLFNPFQPKNVGAEMPYTAAMNGIPPYNCVQVSFKPFAPSELDMRYIGRLKVKIIAEPINPISKEKLGDEWPFDDTSSTKLWVMKRISNFKDNVSEFHNIDKANLPSVYKWVSFGVSAQSGDDYSVYPLAPRGRFEDGGKKQQFLNSPVLLMDRKGPSGDWDDDDTPTTPDGDELRSFPIDLNGKTNPVLSLSIQRGIQKPTQLKNNRGFCDATLVGPEPRTVNDNEAYTVFAGNRYAGRAATTASKYVDEIRVEFALPSPDGVNEVTNITKENWTKLRNVDGAVIPTSAYTLFGAGGYKLGFLEDNPETTIKESDTVLTAAKGIRIDLYDDGFDWDYKKIFIPVPSYYTNASEDIKKNFRFRIKVMAINHFSAHQPTPTIPDDEDPFIIDNVALLADPTEADIEVSSVKIEWPYTSIPASQALNVPISVILSNNSSLDSKSLILRTYITKQRGSVLDTVYCSNKNIDKILAGATISQLMPSWNARLTGPGEYRIHSRVHYMGNKVTFKDIDTTNDYNYNDFKMKFSDAFTYETNYNGMSTNDVETESFMNVIGRGLSLRAASTGGLGTATEYQSGFDYENHPAGAFSGDGSGQIAVKFELNKPDTLFGYQAYFASYNVENTDITFSIYNDDGAGYVPAITAGARIAASVLEKKRGMDELGPAGFNKYSTYLLNTPLLLPAGTFWCVIAQKGKNGLELGAKADRMGMRTVRTSANTQTTVLGESGIHLLIDKSLRKLDQYSGILINNNVFAYENIIGSNDWKPFMPTTNNPGFPHLEHYGLSPKDGFTYTLTRGTWLPMLRPYFGNKSYGTESINIPCPAPEGVVPVELNEFNAHTRNNGVELYWGTASEHNNKGFYVEKATENNKEFSSIAFVESKNGNSNVAQQYSYFDKDVASNQTYTYRLRQVDVDGSNCDSYSQERKVTYTNDGGVVLEANAPNPFTTSTNIAFSIPVAANVRLEVLDMFGSVITTLVDGELKASRHSYNWNGATENGNLVAPGTYVYRLTVNGSVYNSKMTVIR